MIDHVLVESTGPYNVLPNSNESYSAYLGCEQYNFLNETNIVRTLCVSVRDQVLTLFPVKQSLYVGNIDFTRKVFELSNTRVEPFDYPLFEKYQDSLYKRDIRRTTLQAAIDKANKGLSLFIKPYENKEFPSYLIRPYNSLISKFNDIDKSKEVWISDVIPNIESEWRIYIRRGEIVDAKRYSGVVYSFPDKKALHEIQLFATKEKSNLPSSYVCDICVTAKSWSVIEFNDFYSIGNYGLEEYTYFQMLKDRWEEIFG